MRIVTWNMNHWSRSADARANAWAFLRGDVRADVALVQEAVPPLDVDAVYRPIDPRSCNWGSAVVCLSPNYRLRARSRRPLGAPSSEGELAESHPGTAAVADVIEVSTAKPRLVAVSFYGAWESFPADPERPKQRPPIYSATTSHRSISDLSPLLASGSRVQHQVPVVLAGDFNATTQIAAENHWKCEIDEARVLFDRLRALGLHDLIDSTKSTRARLVDCTCPGPDSCGHVRTYRHGNRNASRPTQLDYMFVSSQLLPQVTSCKVWDEDAAWALSDHCPVVVDLQS